MVAKIVLIVSTCAIALCLPTAEASPTPGLQYLRPVSTYHRVNPPNYHQGYFGNDGYFPYPGFGYNPLMQGFPGYAAPNSGFNGFGGFQNGFGYPGGYSPGNGYFTPQTGYAKQGK